jgi:hypothetical protein
MYYSIVTKQVAETKTTTAIDSSDKGNSMKDSRKAITALIRGKPTRPVVAPLWDGIFAAGILGKRYPSQVTTEESLQVADMCGFDPILRLSADRLWNPVSSLQMETRTEQHGKMLHRISKFACPAGTLELISNEPTHTSGTCFKDGSQYEGIHDIIEWYFREILNHHEVMLAQARILAERYGNRACVCVTWLTPFELSFLAYPNIIMLYLDNRERHHELMELHMELIKLIVRVAAKAGFDGYHTAGPPVELVGESLYDEVASSYLDRIREVVHKAGMWFSFHNCGHIRRLLEQGTYNRVRPDMFETLAPPPMGELENLRWAREQLDPQICTRGNMDLEFLKTASPAEIARRSAEILEETSGYRHIVGTADEILAGTPIENVRAMIDGVL